MLLNIDHNPNGAIKLTIKFEASEVEAIAKSAGMVNSTKNVYCADGNTYSRIKIKTGLYNQLSNTTGPLAQILLVAFTRQQIGISRSFEITIDDIEELLPDFDEDESDVSTIDETIVNLSSTILKTIVDYNKTPETTGKEYRITL